MPTTQVVTEDAEWPAGSGPGGAVDSVNGKTGAVVLTAADVGADVAGAAALNIPLTQKSAANGVATLDATGQVPANQLGNAGGTVPGDVTSVNRLVGDVDLRLSDVIQGFSKTDPTRVTASNASAPLTITTPDGSGQVVEPAICYVPEGWNGHKYWGLITGYTGGNSAFENPAVYYSDDGVTFTPVPGVAFPLVAKPAGGNNADPELVLGPDGSLHGFYITLNFPAGQTAVWWTHSANGTTWSTPVILWQAATTSEQATGPTFLYDTPNDRWISLYVDAHNTAAPYPLKRRTCTGSSPGGTWSAPTTCTTTGIPSGRSPWENHISKRGDQLHMVVTFCDNGTGGGVTKLHFGVSDDLGVTWTFNPTPLLSPTVSGWDGGVIYRGDIVPLDDGGTGLYGLWYSASSAANIWRFGYTVIYGGAGATGGTGPAGPPGAAGLSPPGLVAPPLWSAVASVAPAAPGANAVWGCRVIVPSAGTLHDLAVYVGTSSGNCRVGVYDTGDAVAGTRTRLYDSGSVAVPASNGWRIIADPALTVTAGQELELAINCDNGVVTLGKIALTNAALGTLPANFIPVTGGASPKLNWSNSPGTFTIPAGILEANVNPNASMFPIIARVV